MRLDRRAFLNACSRTSFASPLFPGILYTLAAQAQEADGTDRSKPPKITPEMIDQAAVLAGVGPFTADQKQMMIDGLVDQSGSAKAIRALNLPNSVAPAFVFHPMPATKAIPAGGMPCPQPEGYGGDVLSTIPEAPTHIEDVAYASIDELAKLLV